MEEPTLTFDRLPEAVAHLIEEVSQLRKLLERLQPAQAERKPIGIEEASRVVMKAPATIYKLSRKRMIPCYKNGNKLYFYEDELLAWIASGKKKSIAETKDDIEAEMNRSVRHKPKMRNF